jgi:hypothetical protein
MTPKRFLFQLSELALADGSASGHVKNKKRHNKQQQRQSFHRPPPLWQSGMHPVNL